MAEIPNFDAVAAYKYFSASCFNQAWALTDKANRTPAEGRPMPALNQASLYHWLQRDDCNDQRLSVGYWQASRIQVLLGNTDEALRFAGICLSLRAELKPFYLDYAHEALARAHLLAGHLSEAGDHLALSRQLAASVEDKSERELLMSDLAQLEAGSQSPIDRRHAVSTRFLPADLAR